jgi:hypothetical protein
LPLPPWHANTLHSEARALLGFTCIVYHLLCCPAVPQAFKRSTTKYWVRTGDVSTVKRIIIENMPVFVFNKVG